MTTVAAKSPKFGLAGFLLALIALVIAAIQVSAVLEPPKKASSVSIGEIAADIRDAAQRRLAGEEAPQEAPAVDQSIDMAQILTVIGTVLAVLGATAGAIGLYKSEPKNLPMLAIGVGIGAVVMQYIFWLALIICGVILLAAIVGGMEGIWGA